MPSLRVLQIDHPPARRTVSLRNVLLYSSLVGLWILLVPAFVMSIYAAARVNEPTATPPAPPGNLTSLTEPTCIPFNTKCDPIGDTCCEDSLTCTNVSGNYRCNYDCLDPKSPGYRRIEASDVRMNNNPSSFYMQFYPEEGSYKDVIWYISYNNSICDDSAGAQIVDEDTFKANPTEVRFAASEDNQLVFQMRPKVVKTNNFLPMVVGNGKHICQGRPGTRDTVTFDDSQKSFYMGGLLLYYARWQFRSPPSITDGGRLTAGQIATTDRVLGDLKLCVVNRETQ